MIYLDFKKFSSRSWVSLNKLTDCLVGTKKQIKYTEKEKSDILTQIDSTPVYAGTECMLILKCSESRKPTPAPLPVKLG